MPSVVSLLCSAGWMLAATVALLLTGRSSTRPWHDEPLGPGEMAKYDGLAQVVDKSRHADLLVVASFSGGGSRAAASAHAVPAELQADGFAWQGRSTNLSQEIDVVTGVSGGSVAAAHFALHGAAESIRRLPEEFLKVDFQTELVTSILSPASLFRATSPWFGRGHVLAEALDRAMFRGATFGSLNALPCRPCLIVGATDLSTGADFDFTSEQLARLCSSIDRWAPLVRGGGLQCGALAVQPTHAAKPRTGLCRTRELRTEARSADEPQ